MAGNFVRASSSRRCGSREMPATQISSGATDFQQQDWVHAWLPVLVPLPPESCIMDGLENITRQVAPVDRSVQAVKGGAADRGRSRRTEAAP
jgi:hypothetical protein